MKQVTRKQSLTSSMGMVTSNHPLASSVGLSILAAGGNAFDAAAGTAFALSVVEPMMVGPFGGGFTNFYIPDKGFFTIDGYVSAPGKASETMFNPVEVDGGTSGIFEVEDKLNQNGYLSVGTPGNLQVWTHLVEKYGKFPLKDVVFPAIQIARNGFQVSDYLSNNIRDNSTELSKHIESAEIYLPNGAVPQKGQTIRNPNFAQVLEGISRYGSSYLYNGELGQHVEDEMKKNEGLITLDDLKKQRFFYRDSVVGTYKDYVINSVGPVSSGGICLIQMLNILENFDLEQYSITDPQRIHILSEVFKIVFADRYEYIGDPEYVQIPVDGLISKKYALQRSKEIDLDRAQSYQFTHKFKLNDSENTTHFNVTDSEGNIISMTQTINNAFGSKVALKDTGMLLNNCMELFDPNPGMANSIHPFKRCLSSMTPTIITKQSKPYLVLGTPGGRKIFGAVAQALLALINDDLSLQASVEAPRIWTDGGVVELEYEFDEDIKKSLQSMGHDVTTVNRVAGGLNAIMFENDLMVGAACHRADGSPAGLSGGYAMPSKPGDAFRDY